jgi:hypothetical protein
MKVRMDAFYHKRVLMNFLWFLAGALCVLFNSYNQKAVSTQHRNILARQLALPQFLWYSRNTQSNVWYFVVTFNR